MSLKRLLTWRPWMWVLIHIVGPVIALLAYTQMAGFLLTYDLIVIVGWAIGFAGIPVLFLLQRLRQTFAPPPAESSRWRPGWRARVGSVVVPGAAVALLQQVDMSWRHIKTTGPLLVGYSASRFVLSVTMIALCFTLGSILLRRHVRDLRIASDEAGRWFVLSFFTGSAIYSLVVTTLGLFGFLYLVPVLLITVPVLLLAPGELARPLEVFSGKVRGSLIHLQGAGWWARFHLAWCLLWIAGLLLANRGLYPGSTTNDVWAHYLPYFHEVLRSGNVGPNEIWYHFHLSKGAGLFHMLGVLSDGLAGQLVSWAFVILTGVMVFQLTRRFVGDANWSLLSMVVFFSVYRGSFFKNHDVLAAFIAFLVWGLIELDGRTGPDRRALRLAVMGSAYYLGFFQPVGSAFAAAFLSITMLLFFLYPALRTRIRDSGLTLASLIAGVATALLLNYQLTGLAETVPIELFWSLADKETFDRVFGFSGVAFLLHMGADLIAIRPSLDYQGLSDAFRYRQLWIVFPPAFVVIGMVAIAWLLYRWRVRFAARRVATVVFVSFAAAAMLTYAAGYSASLLRIFIFTTFFSAITLTVLAWAAVNTLSTRALKGWGCTAFLVTLGAHSIGQELWYLSAVRRIDVSSAAAYLMGRRSLSDVLEETGGQFKTALEFQDVVTVREFLGPNARILDLGLEPSPGYVYPGVGLVSESVLSLGTGYADLVFGAPEQARTGLKALDINYFLLNLRSPLFSSIAFSRLFEPQHLGRYLRLFCRVGDTYVLSWRGQDSTPIPDRLAAVLELKQKALMNYPSSAAFRQEVRAACDHLPPTWSPGSTSLQAVAVSLGGLLRRGMLGPAVVPSNRAFLNNLATSSQRLLAQNIPSFAAAASRKAIASDDAEGSVFHDELTRLVVETVVIYSKRLCVGRFGDDLAQRLTLTDEREPFGKIYRSREDFDMLIHGQER